MNKAPDPPLLPLPDVRCKVPAAPSPSPAQPPSRRKRRKRAREKPLSIADLPAGLLSGCLFHSAPQPAPPVAATERKTNNFLVVADPGPDPLFAGSALDTHEVFFGLQYEGFNCGTQLMDQKEGSLHTVVRQKKGLVLSPPSPRLEAYRQNWLHNRRRHKVEPPVDFSETDPGHP